MRYFNMGYEMSAWAVSVWAAIKPVTYVAMHTITSFLRKC